MTESPLFPAGQRILDRVQGFLDRLRDEGVRVGVAAGVDLGRALATVPALDRDAFREACRVTLAKSLADLEKIDRVFDEYWSAFGAVPVPPPSELGKVPRGTERRGASGAPPPRARPPREELLRETIEGRYSPRAPAMGHPLFPLPAVELRRFRAGARRFRRSVATLPGRHWQRSPAGPIDLRRTARRGLRTGGEWVELTRRERAPRRADLVVLWDVSGSMREHTSELFALVHALHRTIRRSRVFAFGHDIEDVSSLFQGQPYVRALPEIAAVLSVAGGGTQIAHCVAEFRRHWGAVVRATTTVVIVSDGWDLGETGGLARELERLKREARRVVWVNPYAAERGFAPATAALKAALPFVDLLASPRDFPRAHGARRPPTPSLLAA
jgi:uncharacterized protein